MFEEIDIKNLPDNVFQLLDHDWMLITAGTKDKFNTMTASWGTYGILWNKPIAIIFIRPHRYTFSFVENSSQFTLTVFPEKYRKTLQYCGQFSGRNVDKIKETGLKPLILPSGNIAFEQARIIIECKKLYADYLTSENFIDKEIIHRIYPSKDFHRMYIGEITRCLVLNELRSEKSDS
jgi:flavin reductase (DIM6/NTAB) family NADH-FMN oxidoreductase RutF